MQPTVEQANLIVDVASSMFGVYDLSVREDYSGRGMYGSSAVAITGDDERGIFLAIGYLIATDELPEDAMDWFGRSDSLGVGTVRY